MGMAQLQFAQPVSTPHGYQWVRAKPALPPERKAELYLTDGLASGAGAFGAEWYQPQAGEVPLYRRFVDLQPEKDEILVFANQYGPLGGEDFGPIVRVGKGRDNILDGEPLRAWVREITDMQRAHELWEMLRLGDEGGLAQRIRWEDAETVLYESEPFARQRGAAAASVRIVDQRSHFRPAELRRPALTWLASTINAGVARGRALPRLMWDNGGLGLYQSSQSLLGLMWLQLARVVAGKGEVAAMVCEECGEYFEVSSADAARGKKYCSGACKSKAARKRREGGS